MRIPIITLGDVLDVIGIIAGVLLVMGAWLFGKFK
jgi:hypothetical protein